MESNISIKSKENLRSMITMTNKICVCHMQVNAYKYHLQKYLFNSRRDSKLSVKKIISLLINLQIMSETFREVSIK